MVTHLYCHLFNCNFLVFSWIVLNPIKCEWFYIALREVGHSVT